jgi:hypothetical protein
MTRVAKRFIGWAVLFMVLAAMTSNTPVVQAQIGDCPGYHWTSDSLGGIHWYANTDAGEVNDLGPTNPCGTTTGGTTTGGTTTGGTTTGGTSGAFYTLTATGPSSFTADGRQNATFTVTVRRVSNGALASGVTIYMSPPHWTSRTHSSVTGTDGKATFRYGTVIPGTFSIGFQTGGGLFVSADTTSKDVTATGSGSVDALQFTHPQPGTYHCTVSRTDAMNVSWWWSSSLSSPLGTYVRGWGSGLSTFTLDSHSTGMGGMGNKPTTACAFMPGAGYAYVTGEMFVKYTIAPSSMFGSTSTGFLHRAGPVSSPQFNIWR